VVGGLGPDECVIICSVGGRGCCSSILQGFLAKKDEEL